MRLLYILPVAVAGTLCAALVVPALSSNPVRAADDASVSFANLSDSIVAAAQPALVAAAATPAPPPAKPEIDKPEKRRRNINEFLNGPIVRLKFNFDPEEWENIRKDGRRYAECEMVEETFDGTPGKVYKGVGTKLKGSAGSYQERDGKPGLTISFNKYKGAERFHGMSRFHLNNCAQDGTYLNELIAGEMARKAGVPASRCTHALVTWQGRDMGLYVFKESFTEEFLTFFYKDPKGALYDGGFVKDIEENMEKDEGDPKDREDIKGLIAACKEGDAKKRWELLEQRLDIDRYLSYLAAESILSHWDGYNFNRNNYRLYFDPETRKASFFLHGMDQTFNDPNAPAIRDPGSMIGQAVFSNPAWKTRHREMVDLFYEKGMKDQDWPARITEVGTKLQEQLAKAKSPHAAQVEGYVKAARERIGTRVTVVAKQLGDLPKPTKWDANGVTKLDGKNWRIEGGGAKLVEAQQDGRACLHIRAEGQSAASWRKNVALDPGKYAVEVQVRTAGVEAVQNVPGEGAGVRISGGTRTAANSVKGDAAWQPVKYEFDTPGGEVVLIAELKANKGEVWFDRDSFLVRRVK